MKGGDIADHIIWPLLPDKVDVIYRGAPSLQMQIPPNIINPPSQPTFFHDLKGYFPCKKCNVCLQNSLSGERKRPPLHQMSLIDLIPSNHLSRVLLPTLCISSLVHAGNTTWGGPHAVFQSGLVNTFPI